MTNGAAAQHRDSTTEGVRAPLPADEPRVGIVIVNHNGTQSTALCLLSLSRLTYRNYFVVVVDNSDDQAAVDFLRELAARTQFTLILVPENRGFGAACNIGIQHARCFDAEFVWLLNPDTVVDRGALTALVARAGGAEVPTVCGSKIFYGPPDPKEGQCAMQDETLQQRYRRVWGFGGEIRRGSGEVAMRGWNELDSEQFSEVSPCDYVPGCSMLIPVSVIGEVGLFDESFFLYFEETEWCVRANGAGVALVCDPESLVWHCTDDAKLQRPLAVYYYNRSRLQFWYRLSPLQSRLKMIWQVLTRDLPRARAALGSAPDASSRAVFLAHVRAYRDFLKGRFGPSAIQP